MEHAAIRSVEGESAPAAAHAVTVTATEAAEELRSRQLAALATLINRAKELKKYD